MPAPYTPERVPKGWGYELIIVNSPLYCGKILHFDAGKRCSLHYHVKKTETFYLQSGKLMVKLDWQSLLMLPGDTLHVPANTVHQMYAMEESDLFEFSTQHFDDDSFRIEKGD